MFSCDLDLQVCFPQLQVMLLKGQRNLEKGERERCMSQVSMQNTHDWMTPYIEETKRISFLSKQSMLFLNRNKQTVSAYLACKACISAALASAAALALAAASCLPFSLFSVAGLGHSVGPLEGVATPAAVCACVMSEADSFMRCCMLCCRSWSASMICSARDRALMSSAFPLAALHKSNCQHQLPAVEHAA